MIINIFNFYPIFRNKVHRIWRKKNENDLNSRSNQNTRFVRICESAELQCYSQILVSRLRASMYDPACKQLDGATRE